MKDMVQATGNSTHSFFYVGIFLNSQHGPTPSALALGPGNALANSNPTFDSDLDGSELSLAQEQQTPNANSREPECGNVTQAHRSQKDKSKNMK